MAEIPSVNELVLRWHELREQGQNVSAEELCADRPELLDDLRRQIDALRSMEQFLGVANGPPESTVRAEASAIRLVDYGVAASGDAPPVGSRYRPLRLHARGGLGEVYLARDEELSREVALKRMRRPHASDADCRRFVREGEITGSLEHPGVVPVHGLTRDADGRPCYAMRFVRGQTLQNAIARFHAAAAADCGLLLRQLLTRFVAVCNTIAYAHSRGVVHRDLKPANIMLGDYGETLVVDWGLAKRLDRPGEADGPGGNGPVPVSSERRDGATATGDLLGTPAFMSPEQAAGRPGSVGPASDIYSLGATLYALLTGRPPCDADSVAETLRKVQQGDFAPPRKVRPDTPRALEAICLKAMEREPAARYVTALELVADIERWLADEIVHAYREPWTTRTGRWVRRHRTLVTSLAAVLGVSVLLGGSAVGWLAARRAETVRAARADLDEADRFQREEKWADAQAALQRAEARLGNGGPAELRDRAQQAEANLALVRQVEEILDKFATPSDEGTLPQRAIRIEAAFAQAFDRYGWDPSDLPTEEAAQRLRDSPIQGRLLTALELWAHYKGWANLPGGDHLLAIIAAADPEAWRNELRQAWVRRDGVTLSRLIGQADVRQLPLATVLAVGRMSSRADNAPDVLRFLKAAQKRAPEDGWINLNLGNRLWQVAASKAEAVGYLQVALARWPGNVALRRWVAMAQEESGALAEAELTYKELLRDKPNYAEAHDGLGFTYFRQGRLEQAEAECRTAIDQKPEFGSAYNTLGHILEWQGKLTDALASYDEAIRLKYPRAWVHVNRAVVLRELHRPAESEAACLNAIRAEPGLALAHYHLGLALEEQNKLSEALAAYEATLRSDHGYAEAQNNIGVVLWKQGKYAQSEEAFRKTIRLNPTLPEAHAALARALVINGETIRLNPTLPEAHTGLALCLLHQDRLPEAEAAAREAIYLRPEDARAHITLGNILRKAGQQEKAISEWREAIRLQPTFKEAAGNLAGTLADLGRFEESLQVVRQCPQLGAEWVARAERLVALDRRLPQVLSGKDKPADAEQIEFARLCLRKKLYGNAARFFEAAFAAQLRLAEDLTSSDRYDAARAGALAAGDTARLDDAERALLRRQALGWLRADLDLWAKQLEIGTPEAREAVRGPLQNWRRDTDLAGLRDPAAIGKLPEAEWGPWLKLWADVDALLRRADAQHE
jgi:tetratricopeptide (TPR) repeat protein/tRNA A-37 threonylcarbamoyl transferase component Bud32